VISLKTIPDGYHDLKEKFGDPLVSGFASDYLGKYGLPFVMRASWDDTLNIHAVYIHRELPPAMLDALKEGLGFGGLPYLKENNLDRLGGIHNHRFKVGSPNELSVHAWAAAIDVNPHRGPYGKKPDMPQFIIDAFKKRGFVWGGDWKIQDGMHFQAVRNY